MVSHERMAVIVLTWISSYRAAWQLVSFLTAECPHIEGPPVNSLPACPDCCTVCLCLKSGWNPRVQAEVG